MNYLLSASLATTIFYALFWLVFRRLRFHALNRAYLLTALGASLVIPLVELPVPAASLSLPVQRVFYATDPAPFPEPTFVVAPAEPEPVDWAAVAWYAYLTGASVMALRLGRGLWRLARLLSQPGRQFGGLKVIPTTGPSASFFHWILLNDTGLIDAERRQVLAHEAAHARLGHSADRLALAVLRVAFWFNPVLWLYQRSLAHLHELQVDEQVAQRFDASAYARLLLRLHGGAALPLTNLFSRQPLRDRLTALFQPKPVSTMKKLLYFTAVPVALTVTFALASTIYPTPSAQAGATSLTRAGGNGQSRTNDAPAGHLELQNGWVKMYLNLNHYDPDFMEAAKRVFQSNGVELTVTDERIDSLGRLLSGKIELAQKSGGSATIRAAEEYTKKDGSRWVYLVVHQPSGQVGAGSLLKEFSPAKNALQIYLPRLGLLKNDEGC